MVIGAISSVDISGEETCLEPDRLMDFIDRPQVLNLHRVKYMAIGEANEILYSSSVCLHRIASPGRLIDFIDRPRS